MAVDAVRLWVKFHTPEADRVASFYRETTRPNSSVKGLPLPTQYHLISCNRSESDTASVDLVVTNGGGIVDPETIRRHIEEFYLLAAPRAMEKFAIISGKLPAPVERHVEIGFIGNN